VDTRLPPQIAADKRLRITAWSTARSRSTTGSCSARDGQRDIALLRSNPGSPYISNARWIGALAKPLLEGGRAGLRPAGDASPTG
jgi:hypothetical protein